MLSSVSKFMGGLIFLTGVFLVSPSQVDAATNTLKLKINANCQNGVAAFRVVNKGEQWPKSARFKIYRAQDNTLISDRRLRMTAGQNAAFKVRRGAEPGDELAIYIEPSWYERPFRYDGKISCR